MALPPCTQLLEKSALPGGEVKLAKQIFEEQHYALKIYKKSEIATTSKILRLKSEIELLRLMKHPFILPLLSTFQE